MWSGPVNKVTGTTTSFGFGLRFDHPSYSKSDHSFDLLEFMMIASFLKFLPLYSNFISQGSIGCSYLSKFIFPDDFS